MAMLLPAFAQQGQLTDNELKAAYCFGYFTVQHGILQQTCEPAQTPAPIKQACSDASTEQDAKLRRVLGYLVAKGILFNAGAGSAGAMVAVAQGESDMRSCWAASSPDATTCEANCVRQGRQVSDCFEACYPALCQKPRTCESLDYLPY